MADAFVGATGNVSRTFAYTPSSQLSQQTRDNDAYAWTNHVPGEKAYAVNGLNQYTTVAASALTYDANGNLITDGTNSYIYDAENRLVTATAAGVTATLTWDPMGRLWQLVKGVANTRFLYDDDELVGEYDGAGTMTQRYVHGQGVDDPMIWYEGASVSTATRRQLFADRQGSVMAVADSSGAIIARSAYDEYGIPAATNVGRFQYTGQILLSELGSSTCPGIYHYKARLYSPCLGRFLQTDPVGYESQINLYVYVGNDPMNAADPSGACPPAISGCDGADVFGEELGPTTEARNAQKAQQREQQVALTQMYSSSEPGKGGDGRPLNSQDNQGPPLDDASVPEGLIKGIVRGTLGRIVTALEFLISGSPAQAPAPPTATLPTNAGQLGHIFRNAPGHYARNTPQARSQINNALRNFSHNDRFGNRIFGAINSNGTQTWVQVRNGIIQNSGVNTAPVDLLTRFP